MSKPKFPRWFRRVSGLSGGKWVARSPKRVDYVENGISHISFMTYRRILKEVSNGYFRELTEDEAKEMMNKEKGKS